MTELSASYVLERLARVARWKSPGYCATAGGSQCLWVAACQWTQTESSPKSSGKASERLQWVSSQTIILDVPQMLLKPKDFTKLPKHLKRPPLECPAPVASRRPLYTALQGGGHRVDHVAASQGTLPGRSLKGSSGASKRISRARFLIP